MPMTKTAATIPMIMPILGGSGSGGSLFVPPAVS